MPALTPAPAAPLGKRLTIFVTGVVFYLIGVVSLLYLIAVSAGFVPFTGGSLSIEGGAAAFLFNMAMLIVFAMQHSVMARQSFKARWVRMVPPALERAIFVLATGILLIPMFWFWQPMGGTVWSVDVPWMAWMMSGIGLAGWAYLFLATFAINHFELFGLQQVYQYLTGKPITPVPFKERLMYKFDRHPIMTGVLLGLWFTPTMTGEHLMFSIGMTAYVLVGVYFEERSLHKQWGDTYLDYSKRVGTIVPSFMMHHARMAAAEQKAVI